MKKTAVTVLLFLVAFGSMSFATPTLLSVTIPFSFHAGDAKLPAGDYDIGTVHPSVLTLRMHNGSQAALITVDRVDRLSGIAANSISFRRYGDEYFLAALDGGDFKAKTSMSKSERKLAADVKGTLIAFSLK